MVSQIDTSRPVAGNPTTLSVRQNFTAAKQEIEDLQGDVAALQSGGVSNVTGQANQITVTTPSAGVRHVAMAAPSPVASGVHGGAGRMLTTVTLDAFGRVQAITDASAAAGGGWNATAPLPGGLIQVGTENQAMPAAAGVTLATYEMTGYNGSAHVMALRLTVASGAAWSASAHPTQATFAMNTTAAQNATIMRFAPNGAAVFGAASGTMALQAPGSISCTRLYLANQDVTDLILGLI
jgi:hypothetical protein